MSQMILHCGAKQVPLEAVQAVETPPPTSTHVPIPHEWFLGTTMQALEACNLQATDWSYALNHQGQQMFAMARVKGDTATGHEGVFALRNAHDKVFKASWCYGRRVFCCDNLGFGGEIVIGRKHTPGILEELPDLLHSAVAHITGIRDIMEGRYEAYQESPFDDEQADHWIGEALRRRIFPDLRSVYVAQAEWDNPTYEEFAEHKNVWRMFNACTEAFKETGFPNPGRTMRLHSLADEFCGVTIDAEATEITIN